jgi:hypothetical protein
MQNDVEKTLELSLRIGSDWQRTLEIVDEIANTFSGHLQGQQVPAAL